MIGSLYTSFSLACMQVNRYERELGMSYKGQSTRERFTRDMIRRTTIALGLILGGTH
jgi:hypothetical protein